MGTRALTHIVRGGGKVLVTVYEVYIYEGLVTQEGTGPSHEDSEHSYGSGQLWTRQVSLCCLTPPSGTDYADIVSGWVLPFCLSLLP